MEWLYLAGSLASAIAAVLAWAAKLWWGREFAAAKDEIINAKTAQIDVLKAEIESLRELTPMKIREYFVSVREQLEEYVDNLKLQLDEANAEIQGKESELNKLRTEGDQKGSEIEKLEKEKEEIEKAARELEHQMSLLQEEKRVPSAVEVRVPVVDLDAIRKSAEAYSLVSRSIARQIAAVDYSNITRIMKQYQEASATATAITKMWADGTVTKEKDAPSDEPSGTES